MKDKSKKKPAKMGRPLKGWEPRSEMLRIRISPTERTMLERDARKAGLPISELLMRPWRGQAEGKKGGE